ncbi:putative non-specific serine/threonine protein kinase [Helianthus annuus]|nr:putative non-specific serine/threonine protein kinase [Helianthus annuus]
MPLTRLCFVLPTDSDDKPVEHDHQSQKLDARSHKHRGCSIHIPGVLKRALHRLYDTGLNILCHGECSCGFCQHGPSVVFHDTEGVHFPNEKAFAGHSPKTFSYSELYIGTKGFSKDEILGSGGFGRVYRAVLPRDGSVVAVKCLMENR